MSMLAERRRKTKWIINPTKKPIWTTDSEGIKLGKQLMEKMGWSTGKGLGANEQGIQEPLKVSYKNDTKGMGFKGNDEDWIEHQDEFNLLLSELSSSDPNRPAEVNKNEIKSLEEKSKLSRARVHYQKFTRGKDLSRYSETDLACILGVNHNKKSKNSLKEKSPVEEKKDGNYETSFGVTTINSGSIQDYFKKKWTIGQSKEINSSKTSNEVTEDTLNNTEECAVTSEQKKSKKRKVNEFDAANIQVSEDKIIKTLDEVENSEVGEDVTKNRESKKRKLNELDGGNLEVCENETVEVENFCNLEIAKESKKHKKSKKKKKEEINIECESVSKPRKKEKCDVDNSNHIEENNLDTRVTADVKNVGSDNDLSSDNKKYESLQLLIENSKDENENFTRKRKKDKKKHKVKELDELEENIEPVQESFDPKIKKKKKKDKEKKEKDHVTQSEMKEVSGENYSDKDRHNSSLTESDEFKTISNGDEKIQKLNLKEDTAVKSAADLESEKSRKEKRRKDKHKLDQPKLEEEQKSECKIVDEEVESKSKKKKRKEKLTDQSLLENEEAQTIKTENVLEEVEPVVKEKKKKGKHETDQSGVDNETETKSTSEESKTKEKKKKEKLTDQSLLENEEAQTIKTENVLEEVEPVVKEKKKKGKHKTDQSEVDNETETKSTSEESKTKEKKKKEKLTDQSLLENEEAQTIKTENVLEEVEPVVKEKKKKGKHKTDQSEVDNETETKSTSEESKTKEKKKKEKHRSDQSTVENEEEQVRKSKRKPEETEPKVDEKVSKKNKLGETKKLKHKTDSEGAFESNIISETVEETNDTIATQKENEMLKKAEVDTKLKEDCKKLGEGNKPRKDESKTENSNRIHSHKIELFKKKNESSLLGKYPGNSRNNRVLGLIFGAEFDKFKGANIENLVGYGMQKKIQGKDDG